MKHPQNKKNNPKVVNVRQEKSAVVEQKQSVEKKPSLVQRFPKSMMAIKFFSILAIVVGVVAYTDSKRYFEPNLGYHDTFVKSSFEKLIETDSVDICVFGNSHVGNGINTTLLSNALGTICYNYYQPGTDLQDVYYALQDVVDQHPIKIAVIETYTMTNARAPELKNGKNKFQSFKQLSNGIRLKATLDMFNVEQIGAAWSNTIRNHEFLFRDTLQMKANQFPKYKEPTFYLGSSGHNDAGITDSLDAVYDSLGAIMDGNVVEHDEFDMEYIEKIDKLCKEHNVKLVFLTLPEYYKNIKNYGHWRDVVAEVVKPTNAPWLDLQKDYDTLNFKKEYWQNKRNINQHIVQAGMPCMTIKLAQFLLDSCRAYYTDRSRSEGFVNNLYNTEGYLYNNHPKADDATIVNICDNLAIGDFKVNNAFCSKYDKSNYLFVKLEKTPNDVKANKLTFTVKGVYNGKEVSTPVDMYRVPNQSAKYNIYQSAVVKEFIPSAITDIKN